MPIRTDIQKKPLTWRHSYSDASATRDRIDHRRHMGGKCHYSTVATPMSQRIPPSQLAFLSPTTKSKNRMYVATRSADHRPLSETPNLAFGRRSSRYGCPRDPQVLRPRLSDRAPPRGKAQRSLELLAKSPKILMFLSSRLVDVCHVEDTMCRCWQ